MVVVALVEELFWRGYLMRLMVNPDHPWKVPFGTHSWKAYWVTTLCFMAVHQPVDYCGAFVTVPWRICLPSGGKTCAL